VTDGQNYDSQDRASIAASRGENHFFGLLGLCAEYRSRRWMWSTLLPTVRSFFHRRTKLTAPETISGSRDMVVPAKI